MEAEKISPNAAIRMLEEGKAVVLDVRTDMEYSEERIPGSIHLDWFEMTEDRVEKALPDREKTVLVVCRSGRRSAPAASRLEEYGYTVRDAGGLLEWPETALDRTPLKQW